MRSRSAVTHTSDVHDLKNMSSSDIESIKSTTKRQTTTIIPSFVMIFSLLCLGILCGVEVSIFINSHCDDIKSIQNVHKNVKHVYRAHNEARKEYLKRYREAYLE
jgi:hypothetical protein